MPPVPLTALGLLLVPNVAKVILSPSQKLHILTLLAILLNNLLVHQLALEHILAMGAGIRKQNQSPP